MKHAAHDSQLSRLRRIEGQIAGIARMVEEKRYCVDLLTQLRAARTAIKRVEEQILREHVEHCVVNAVRVGKRAEQQQKIDELKKQREQQTRLKKEEKLRKRSEKPEQKDDTAGTPATPVTTA